MSEHSKFFSPSSIARRIACHLSAFLEADIKDDGQNPAADWGTSAHYIFEQTMKGNKNLESWNGETVYRQVVCDDEMISCVRQCIADANELMSTNGSIDIEKRVSLAWLGYPEMFGTCDMVCEVLFDTLTIMDEKYGAGVSVSPVGNPQLMAYALMAAGETLQYYDKIKICISQPRAKEGGKSLKIWETTPEHLRDWFINTLEPTIQAIKSGDRTANPSEDVCRFCKAKSICPDFSGYALEVARMDFSDVSASPVIIDDAMVNQVYRKLPLLTSWIKQVEARAFEMAQRGDLQGYKVVSGRKSRNWISEEEAEELFIKNGIDPFEYKLLSPAKAEKALPELKGEIRQLVSISDGKPVIAPENDKRPAICAAAEDFKSFQK